MEAATNIKLVFASLSALPTSVFATGQRPDKVRFFWWLRRDFLILKIKYKKYQRF